MKMKKKYTITLLALCAICFSFFEYYVSSTLGVPTVEEVYGGRINYINGYQFHPDSTRIFVSTQSANSVFYANILSSSSPSIDKFQVVPSLDDTNNFGSAIKKVEIHEASESIYFINENTLYSTTITEVTANSTGVSGVNDLAIKGDYVFAAGSGQLFHGTLNATNSFTSGSGSPIGFPSIGGIFYLNIHPISEKMYVFSKGTSPSLYVSTSNYNAFDATTTFSDISPTLTSTAVTWTAFSIGPDGRFFIGGNNNTSKFIAYSDDDGTTWNEYDTGIVGTSATNFDFSGDSSSYYVLFASMFSDDKGISGTWQKFGTTTHYTHPNDGAVFVDPNNENIFYSTSDQGLGISLNQGVTVISGDEGIEAVQVKDMEMTIDKKSGWIASKSGIRKVTDYDTSTPSWTNSIWPNGDGSGYFSIAMKPSDDETAYAGNVRVYKTSNNGSNWTQVFTPESSPYNYPNVGTQINALTICPFDESIVFAGVEIKDSDKGGLFVSEDAGGSWSQVLLHTSSGNNDVDVNDIIFTQEGGTNTAYIGVQYDLTAPTGRSVYKLTQTSSGWSVSQDMNSGTTSTGTTIVVSINDLDYNASNNTVYATGTDAGTNHPVSYYKPLSGTGLWTVNTSSGFPTSSSTFNKQGKAIVHDGTNTLYCAVDHEIYYLTTGASSWTLGYSYPVGTEINCLFYDELLVGTGTGLYAQADPSSTASVNDKDFITISTYPNPVKTGNYLTIQYENEIINPTYRITNIRGQLIQEFKKNEVQYNTNSSKIKIPKKIQPGLYLLSVYNKKKKLLTKKIVVN